MMRGCAICFPLPLNPTSKGQSLSLRMPKDQPPLLKRVFCLHKIRTLFPRQMDELSLERRSKLDLLWSQCHAGRDDAHILEHALQYWFQDCWPTFPLKKLELDCVASYRTQQGTYFGWHTLEKYILGRWLVLAQWRLAIAQDGGTLGVPNRRYSFEWWWWWYATVGSLQMGSIHLQRRRRSQNSCRCAIYRLHVSSHPQATVAAILTAYPDAVFVKESSYKCLPLHYCTIQ